nr:T9SS type A sorting domain-containing protein [Bacteroidota bacterium]
DLNLYSSIFLCLGVYSDNTVLGDADGQALADYLNDGGNLYMEGGDTWYYDDPTAVHAMFGINGTSDGSSDLGSVNGLAGTFTEGMSFNYTGDNSWIDNIEPTGDADLILENQSPNYGTGIANDAGSYKTIGASHEFGGLSGDRVALMEGYLNFFGMMPSTLVANFNADVTEGCMGMEVAFTDASVGAISWNWSFPGGTPETSTDQNPVVEYNSAAGNYDVILEIGDGTNTTTMTKNDYITVMDVPGQAGPINGDDMVVIGDVKNYDVTSLDDCTLYEWLLTPEDAGTMVIEMNVVTITFSETWTGDATLKVCGGNDCGMGAFSEDFEIIVYDPTGINEIGATSFNIYPNPNNGEFTLDLSSAGDKEYEVILINPLGMEILNKTFVVNGIYSEQINVSDLAEGIYYLQLRNNEGTIIKKLVIQK